MDGMYVGYFYGVNATWTVGWDDPRFTIADASLQLLVTSSEGGFQAVAWVRSVTVKDPVTGQITEKPSEATVGVRIEANAIAVTFGLNIARAIEEAEALIHVYWWPS